MSALPTRHVQLDPGPEVQLHGDVVMLRGAAALDAYRLVTEGIRLTGHRDGIAPSPRLLQIVAALKAAAPASSSATAEIAELRKGPTATSLRSGEVIGIEEVARMFGVGLRQARHLAPSLGGWRTAGRGRPWAFDRGLVQAYINAEARR